MNISKFEVNPFGEITYILWDKNGGEAMIVDPGMMTDAERDMVVSFLETNQLTLKMVLLTHLHIDHVPSARWMAQKFGVTVAGNKGDAELGKALPLQAQHFRLWLDLEELILDRELNDGDQLKLGDEEIKVIHTPGHSMGSLSFYVPESGFVVTGDALFNGSIGRTDLPGGDFSTLINAIKTKLLTLPGDTMVYPGHGPATTIADEARYNPYLG